LLNGIISIPSPEPSCEYLPILSQGFVYSTTVQPTIDNIVKEVDGEIITEVINELEIYTTYYVRTFLSTETETSYGNEITFTVENIYNGDVHLNTQNQVDSFGNNINNYNEIDGNLYIGDSGNSEEILNLDSLNGLFKISGNLRITDNTDLTTLSGLDNLIFAGGDISILFNDSLINISSLGGLTVLQGSIYVSLNNSLENLTGLNNLNTINGDLGIGGASIIDLEPLSSLTNIGGSLLIDSSDILLDLNGLENLTTIGGNLWVGFGNFQNYSLISLNGLENLTSLGGEFKIIYNPSLIDYCSIENLIISLNDNGNEFNYIVENNLYNPTIQDILDGNCSL